MQACGAVAEQMKQLELLVKNKILARGILAFLGTYGICYILDLAGAAPASFSVMSVLFWPVIFWLLGQTEKSLAAVEGKQRGRRRRYGGIVSFLFAVSMIMGYQLQANGMTECGLKGKGLILFRAACLGIAVFPFGNLLFRQMEKLGSVSTAVSDNKKEWKPAAVFGVSAAAIFVCLIPVWLAYYPIIMSYDFHRQVNEAAKGFAWFWPYQPIAHTWVIWLFLQLGYRLGSPEAGMAGMALFQMLAYSLTMGYACAFLYRIGKKRWMAAAAVLYFGVFPLNSVMVLCTTKDVLFSVLFLLFVLLLAERFFFRKGKETLMWDVLILLEGCLMMQFRNNAIYAAAVFGVLWTAFAPRKEKLRVLLLCVLLIAGGRGTSALIKAALGTELSSAKVEMYSVPIQQFARVGYYHGQELDEETRRLLNQYIPEEDWESYNAPLADTVKAGVGVTTFPETWDGHMGQLLWDWAKIGLKYPNEYIDAFLELTRGYWFLDDRSYAECLGYGVEGRMGVIYTYYSSEIADVGEIKHESKLPWLEEQLEKIVSGNEFYRWPVISLLFKCAFYVWGLGIVFLAFLFLRQRKQALFCLFPLVYLGTMLLGPVVQMRYIFPIMVTLPILAVLLLWPKDAD